MAPTQCNQAMPVSSTDRWDSGGCYCASDTRANSQSEWSTKFSETETTVKRADGALVHESGSGNCRPGELVGRSRRTRQSENRYCGAQTARFIFHWLLRRQNPDGRRGILGQKRLLTFWSVAHRVCMHVLWNKLTPSLSFANSRTWNRVQHASCCQNDAFLSYFENAWTYYAVIPSLISKIFQQQTHICCICECLFLWSQYLTVRNVFLQMQAIP